MSGRTWRAGADGEAGRRARRLVAAVALVVGGTGLLVPAAGSAAARPSATLAAALASDPATRYQPLPAPARVLDTRDDPGARTSAHDVRVPILGRPGVPAGTVAVAVNVTVTDTTAASFVTVGPSGAPTPLASVANPPDADSTVADLVFASLGTDGAISVHTSAPAQVVVDLLGTFVPAGGMPVSAGRLVPATPVRLLDTRVAGGALAPGERRTVSTDGYVPATAAAAIVNLTVAEATQAGYWSVIPPSQPSATTSTTNATAPGDTVAATTITILERGRFDIVSQTGGQAVVDLAGWVTGPGDAPSRTGLYVPLGAPVRVIDTRETSNPLGAGQYLFPGGGVTLSLAQLGAPAESVGGVVGTLTAVHARRPGWLAAYPAGTAWPGTSSVNTTARARTVANHLVARVSDGGLSVVSSAGAHVLLDVSGFLLGIPLVGPGGPVANLVPALESSVVLEIPRIGVRTTLALAANEATLDAGGGILNPFLAPGAGLPVTVMAHRTAGPATFNRVGDLQPGDVVVATTVRDVVTYVVTSTEIIPAERLRAVLASQPTDRETVTLVACSGGDGSPGGVSHRMLVHGELLQRIPNGAWLDS